MHVHVDEMRSHLQREEAERVLATCFAVRVGAVVVVLQRVCDALLDATVVDVAAVHEENERKTRVDAGRDSRREDHVAREGTLHTLFEGNVEGLERGTERGTEDVHDAIDLR